MTHRGLSRSTLSSTRPRIAEYVAIRPDAFDGYKYQHELTVTEGYTLLELLLKADRHTRTIEGVNITSLAEYVGLTREVSEGHARRRMKQVLDRLINIGAIAYVEGTVTVLVYDELVRFAPTADGRQGGGRTSPSAGVIGASSPTASSGATYSISEAPETVSGRASARDIRAYTRDDRASARERTGETPPTNELETNPPTPQDDEVSIALAALHDRVGGTGRRFATTERLRDVVQARIADGWQPNVLVDALTYKELDTANDVAAVLTSRAERLEKPERAPRSPDWTPEPVGTDDERARALVEIARIRSHAFPTGR